MRMQKVGCTIWQKAYLFICVFMAMFSESFAGAREITPPQFHYKMCLAKLQEIPEDKPIIMAFEEALNDTKTFVDRLSNTCGGSTHSKEWVTNFQNAVNAAKVDNWLEARNQLSLTLGLQNDIPDCLLMKAVADRKTGAFETTILDLESLCRIIKERKNGYKTAWERQTGFQDDYWYSNKVLKSYLTEKF